LGQGVLLAREAAHEAAAADLATRFEPAVRAQDVAPRGEQPLARRQPAEYDAVAPQQLPRHGFGDLLLGEGRGASHPRPPPRRLHAERRHFAPASEAADRAAAVRRDEQRPQARETVRRHESPRHQLAQPLLDVRPQQPGRVHEAAEERGTALVQHAEHGRGRVRERELGPIGLCHQRPPHRAPLAPEQGDRCRANGTGPIRTTPVALFRRERGAVWRSLVAEPDRAELALSHSAAAVLGVLDERGASFFGDLVNATGLLRTEVEKGLGELVAWGLVTADSFAGLRALLVPSDRRRPIGGFRRRGKVAPFGVETAGRWSRVRSAAPLPEEQVAEAVAWQLLRRYGVVFRRLATREGLLAPWRDILRAYRRLEARGEIRGGRFVGGFSGEQYALPE